MSIHSKLSFFVFLILMSSCSSRAYLSISKDNFIQLKREVSHLQNNTLIVRLYTNNPKIKVLRKSNNTKALNEHLSDRVAYINLMMEAWNESYDFSEVLYMPDSLFKTFVADRSSNVFLNEKLVLDDSISLKTDDYYVLARGSRDLGFVWYNSKHELLNPQPPINFDKLTPWEMINGKEKFLKYRISDLNDYFYKVIKTPSYE